MSLYGIETEEDCRAKIGELLELQDRAAQAKGKDATRRATSDLNSRLAEYHKTAGATKRESCMSAVERAYFWPAIQEAYAFRANLARPATWSAGLDEVRWKLEKHRPEPGGKS